MGTGVQDCCEARYSSFIERFLLKSQLFKFNALSSMHLKEVLKTSSEVRSKP